MSTTIFQGRLCATAESKHPLQTNVTFILTDFQPNKNKQAIPRSEADNIIRTAIGMPVKIRYDGVKADGHRNAQPIGPITRAWIDSDNGAEVIMAEAALWNSEFAEVDAYLKSAHAENESVGTSWEIFYTKSTKDDTGIEWLEDTIVAASAIVKDPAYGKSRTRMLAVAEENEDMHKAESATSDEVMGVIENLQELLSVLNDFWYELFEQERTEEKIVNADNVLEKTRVLLDEWKTKKLGYAETSQKLATAETETTTLRAENSDLKAFKNTTEQNQLFATRKQALASFMSAEDIDTRRASILAMNDTAFTNYTADLELVARKAGKSVATAETKDTVKVPDLIGNGMQFQITDLAIALKNASK